MPKLLAVLLATLLFSAGCGGEGTVLSPVEPAPAPPPPPATGGVRVRLDFAAARQLQAKLPEDATRYLIQVRNANGSPAAQATEASATPGQALDVLIDPVTVGTVLVQVSGLTEEGALIGAFEQEASVVQDQVAEVVVSSLFEPGPTREVGLLAVSSSGVQANAPTTRVAISSTGRYVAFVTAATNLSSVAGSHLYLRDRQTGILTRIPRAGSDPRAFGPAVSSDGATVAFLDSLGAVVVWKAATGLSQTVLSTAEGSVALLTSDGRFIYATTAQGQVVRRRLERQNDPVEVLAPGFNALPGTLSISSDGSRILFSESLSGSSFTQPILYDVATGAASPVLTPDNASVLTLSPDGGQAAYLVGGNLKLVDLATGVTRQVLTGVDSFSLSEGFRSIAFLSSQPGLVANDANQTPDVFAWSAQTGQIARLNVAADGTAVEGSVSQVALSADASRAAFITADRLLVPGDTNQAADAFSAAVPTPGKLYVSVGEAILRYDLGLLGGSPVILSKISGQQFGPLSLNSATNELFVAVNQGGQALSIARISGPDKASGVAPVTVLTAVPGTGAFRDLWFDPTRNFVYASTRNGQVVRGGLSKSSVSRLEEEGVFPAANWRGGLFLDPRRRELYVGTIGTGGQKSVQVFQSESKPAALLRELTNQGSVLDVDLDAGPRGFPGQNRSNMVMLQSGDPLSGFNRLTLFGGNGSVTSFGASSALANLRGTATQLGSTLPSDARGPLGAQMVVDRFTGQTYVLSPAQTRALRFAGVPEGNVAPLQRFELGAVGRGIALDRTR